ncbi:hypothetical protein QFZ34_000928 [Phyllobacterium ifriqiyense]|uniref:Pilus assembly protein n=1 Tax=Phyllobacterium ifriqiyense TaxID=314238 RepID=A0ABU0S5F1_9HYPH|nr:hypothetical protein [Phyllobacterium ifriqiyense]MDQ0995751.1 hypothetical protein [Phyllobacterium ifriqiyense]
MLNNRPMSPNCFGLKLLLLTGVVVLSGCMGTKIQPYSPNYSYIDAGGTSRPGVVRKGYDSERAAMLVPDACITPDTGEYPMYLPSGCANNLNLQHMAAKKQDLMRGREMGPAMAAPVARAAQNYIEGTDPETRRRRLSADEANRSTQ